MENTPLITKKSENKEPEKTTFTALILINIVLSFWTIANHFHSPIPPQYLYMRVKEEIYANGTEPEKHNFTCFKNTSSEDFKLQEKAQQITNTMQMHFTLIKAGCGLISNSVLGSSSDFVGRKMVFLVPTVGCLLRNSIFTAIIFWHMDLRLYYAGEILEELTGGSNLFKLGCYVWVSDHTPAKRSRTWGMVVIDVTTSLSEAAVSSVTGFFYPSLVSAVLMIGVILAIIFILPGKANRKGATMTNVLTSCKNVFTAFGFEGSRRRKTLFFLAMITYMIIYICRSIGDIDTLWQLNYPFCWDPEMIGYYKIAVTLLKHVLALPLLRLFQVCMSDEIVTVWSCLVTAGGNVFQGFSYTNWMMYGVAIISCLSLGVSPIIRAILSRLTTPHKQGALMASLTVIEIVCKLAGEPMFSFIYRSTIFVMRGAVYFVVASGFFLSAFVFTVFTVVAKGYNYRHYSGTGSRQGRRRKLSET